MFDCENCGRNAGKQIGSCPRKGTPECPYIQIKTRMKAPRMKGVVLMCLGLFIIWFFLYFPLLALQEDSEEWLEIALRMSMLSIAILSGLGFAIVGFAIFASKRYVVYSPTEQKFWEMYVLNGYEYSYRSLSNLQELPEICAPGKEVTLSPALAAAESYHDLMSLLNRYRVARGSNKLTPESPLISEMEKKARYCFQVAFMYLCAKKIISIKVGELYDSSGKNPETLRAGKKVVLNVVNREPILTGVERDLYNSIKQWEKSEWFSYSPLGATIDLLIHELTKREPDQLGEVSYTILERVAASMRQQIKSGGFDEEALRLSQQESREMVRQGLQNYPKLMESMSADMEQAIRAKKAPLIWGIFSPEMFTWRSVRVGTVVVLFMTGVLGFYSMRVHNVQKVTSYIGGYKDPAAELSKKAIDNLSSSTGVEGLKSIARSATRAIDSIGQEMRGNSKYLRLRTLDTLAAASQSGDKLSELYYRHKAELQGALHDADPRIRAAAMDVLRRYGPNSQDLMPSVMARLSLDESPLVRQAAAHTLGSMGVSDPTIQKALVDAFFDADDETKKAAMVAYGTLVDSPPQEQIDAFRTFSRDPVVGSTANKVLRSWGIAKSSF